MSKNSKMCISVVIDSLYERYLPLFCFFIQKSYPEYFIKIFVRDRLSTKTKKDLFLLDANKIDIEERFFRDFPVGNQHVKSIRWLIPEKYFCNYDYVYIGDVDILICKEDLCIYTQHTKHMEANEICYSNCIRPGKMRMTGLHFFDRIEYYKKVGALIGLRTAQIKEGKIRLSNEYRNEHLLYDILVESGVGLPLEQNRIDSLGSGPHHGLHLGIWRKSSRIDKKELEQTIFGDNYSNHFKFFTNVKNDSLYKELIKSSPLTEIKNMETYFKKILDI